MKLYYVVNARMPSQKAYGIQIAKMCEAFIEQGIDLELIIPKTRGSGVSLREFYDLRVEVPTRVLPGLDWYDKGSVPFALAALVFMASACLYLLKHRSGAFVYTIDMDSYSYSPLALLGIPFAAEMHSPKSTNIFTRLFFKRATHIIAVNALIRDELMRVFGLASKYFLIEPNGVDSCAFTVSLRQDARTALGLPVEEKIALYAGRFYDWKGMDILLKAAVDLRAQKISLCLVGGTQEEFEAATGESSAGMRFAGSIAHKDIGRWYAAADVLVVLGTKANAFSYRYTAPMKMYEYMAAGRPVVAANTPALRELASEQEVVFYPPDDPASLAREIAHTLSDQEGSKSRVAKSLQKAQRHLWEARAERIAAFVGVAQKLV